MKSLLRKIYLRRNYIAVLHDAVMAGFSFYISLYLRFGYAFNAEADYIKLGIPLFTVVCLSTFITMRLYKGLWRYASLRDLTAIIKAVTLAIVIFLALMFMVTRLESMPRSVLAINWLLLVVMLGAPRFIYRLVKDGGIGLDLFTLQDERIPVLLVGLGTQADLFLRDSANNKQFMYRVVGVVDDNPSTHGRSVRGVRVYGGLDSLAKIIDKLERKGAKPRRIIITGDLLIGTEMKDVLEVAEGRGVPLARLPSLSDFKEGQANSLEARPVAIEDILGRAQNRLDYATMQSFVANRRILVTGGGGTIGGEIVMQVCSFKPAKVVILDNSEFNLYEITRRIRGEYPEIDITSAFADVRDEAALKAIFMDKKPDVVFHAAAIKHVPIAEENPAEAVHTNVFGSMNVLAAANGSGVQVMVLISTDKAVNPVGVMGAAKRLAELCCHSLAMDAGVSTRVVAVRFGNVLASRGSVVPLFREQLANGGPLTVSHPEIIRYFMTLREAVGLVITASALAEQSPNTQGMAVYVLEMGAPVRIKDMAEQMIRLAGLHPYKDIEIIYTGLRPGEKLFEELFYPEEAPSPTAHPGVMIAKGVELDKEMLRQNLIPLRDATLKRDDAKVRELLQGAVSIS